MRIIDWSSYVCSSDLRGCRINRVPGQCHDAGARHSYYARPEQGTTISRDNSQFDETLCACCSFRGYSDVTHTGEIKSEANRRSVDRRTHGNFRSDESRVESEWFSTGSSRGSPDNLKNKKNRKII